MSIALERRLFMVCLLFICGCILVLVVQYVVFAINRLWIKRNTEFDAWSAPRKMQNWRNFL